MTFFASLTEITLAVIADVVVERIPTMLAKVIGPDTTSLLVLIKANSCSAGESWIDFVLPFNEISCQKRFQTTSFSKPGDMTMGPVRNKAGERDLFFMVVWIFSISNCRKSLEKPFCIRSKNENAAVAYSGIIQSFPYVHRSIASVEDLLFFVSHTWPRAADIWKFFFMELP